jgi:hypothetical protein
MEESLQDGLDPQYLSKQMTESRKKLSELYQAQDKFNKNS